MTRPITFVPGTMCDERVWHPVWAQLQGKLTCNYLPIHTARSAAEFRQHFHNAADAEGPLNLVAFSMGGYLAMEFAIGHPDKVASLVTICSSAFGLHDEEKKQRQSALEYLKTHIYKGIVDARLNQMLHPDHRSGNAIKQIMRDMDHDLGVETLITQLSETTERIDLSGQLNRITCPTLMIAGDTDPFLTELQLAIMTSEIPNAKSAIAPDCGHMVPLERPLWLAGVLSEFYGAS